MIKATDFAPARTDDFATLGYAVFPTVSHTRIDDILASYLSLVAEKSGMIFEDASSPELTRYFEHHLDVESQVYTSIREKPWLVEFSLHPEIVEPVRSLLGADVALLGKIPFRIDLPRSVSELALWQGYFYVRGNTSIVTAWIPMQDTSFVEGALTVMPGSHQLGPLTHDLEIGKRNVPSGVYDREIRMVEMRKGELLLFDSLLLHSGNLNLTDRIRYSIQARFTPRRYEVDASMGATINA